MGIYRRQKVLGRERKSITTTAKDEFFLLADLEASRRKLFGAGINEWKVFFLLFGGSNNGGGGCGACVCVCVSARACGM